MVLNCGRGRGYVASWILRENAADAAAITAVMQFRRPPEPTHCGPEFGFGPRFETLVLPLLSIYLA